MWKMAPYQATEQAAWESKEGPSLFYSGPFYCQYGAATAIASTAVETTLLAGAPSVTSFRGPLYDGMISTLLMPGEAWQVGTHFGGDFYGIIQTNATPGLRMRLGLVGGATATTFNALSDNATLALVACAAGTYFHVFFRSVVTARDAAAGSFRSFIGYEYGSTAAGSATTKIVPAPQALATFNTTLNYTFDIRATFDASHANNTIQLQFGQVWMLG
jgi:hypothetical protein